MYDTAKNSIQNSRMVKAILFVHDSSMGVIFMCTGSQK